MNYAEYLKQSEEAQADFRDGFADRNQAIADGLFSKGATQVVIKDGGKVIHQARSLTAQWSSDKIAEASLASNVFHGGFTPPSRVGMGPRKIRTMEA